MKNRNETFVIWGVKTGFFRNWKCPVYCKTLMFGKKIVKLSFGASFKDMSL